MSLVPLFLLIAVVIIVLVAAGVKAGNTRNGGEDVIKNIYVYLVLFATLMMVIGGSVAAFMAVADIVAPSPYYQQFEDYKYSQIEMHKRMGTEQPEAEQPQLNEQELRERYDALAAEYRDQQIERAKNSLIKSFGWIIIPLPVFIYFQRRLAGREASGSPQS